MRNVDIIVPCYNEEEVIETFFVETQKVVTAIPDFSFNYLFVNDGSKDNTLNILRKLASENSVVKYISFSKNFGKEAAMFAGLENSTGDYVIIMDADLQHPPALIVEMIKAVMEGYDCCAAYRTNRKGEARFRSFLSKGFYKLNNRLSNIELPYGAVDYRIMSRQMVEAIKNLPETLRFSKGIFSWIGFDTKWIPYENVERTMGTTKWSLKGLFFYAIDGIASFSVAPLRMVSIMGAIISMSAFIYAIVVFIKTLCFGIDAPGYASLIIIVLFLGGIIELSLGIIGEYIARIFIESKGRPIYIAKESNLDNINRKDNSNEK